MINSKKDLTARHSLILKSMNKTVLGHYSNGNHLTSICSDGTRIRSTFDEDATEFTFDFAENFDCKITDYCDGGCPYCHEGSTTNGKHCDINLNIFKTLHPYQEVAIGGGNLLAHPQLIELLTTIKQTKAIANITVNQKHLSKNKDLLYKLQKEGLIQGIGVSLTNSSSKEDLKIIESLGDNCVIHVINGILTEADLEFIKNKKVLILGYKDNIRNGKKFYDSNTAKVEVNKAWLKANLNNIKNNVKTLSFDNLALVQLDAKNTLNISDDEWVVLFQGKENTSTFYVDAATKTIGKTSTCPIEERATLNDDTTYDEAFNMSKEISWQPIDYDI